MRTFPLLLAVLIAVTGIGILSCKKEPDPNKDNHLFICKINGKEWKPKVEFCFLCPPEPEQYADTGGERTIRLEATQDYTENGGTKVFQFFNIKIVLVQENNEPTSWNANFYDLYDGCGDFSIDNTYSNVLKISRFDGVYRGILKGEFEFRLVNKDKDCPDTLLVTDGIFDLRTDL